MRRRVIFLALLPLLASLAQAADPEVEALLANMRKAYSAIKTAKITTKTILPSQAGEFELTTETTFQSPNHVWAKVSGFPGTPASLIVRTDGKKVVQEGPQGKKEEKWSLDAVNEPLPINLETLNLWDWKRQLSTGAGGNMQKSKFRLIKRETWKNIDWLVLEETAPEAFVRYFIDPKTYLIHRTRYERLEGNELVMDAKITKIELNPKVDPKLFKL